MCHFPSVALSQKIEKIQERALRLLYIDQSINQSINQSIRIYSYIFIYYINKYIQPELLTIKVGNKLFILPRLIFIT